MKKYKLKHDSTLLSTPTTLANDCNQITDAGMGIGKGQIIYGVPSQRKRMGIGMQSFIHIASPTHISGKEVLGMYVPANAVQELPNVKGEIGSSSAEGDINSTQRPLLPPAKVFRGMALGILTTASVISLVKDENKNKVIGYIALVGAIGFGASLFMND